MPSLSLSALCTTYHGDNPAELSQSLCSIRNQTRPPDELVLVKDGPVPEVINNVIRDVLGPTEFPVEVVSLPRNRGHGAALREAVKNATKDIVAIHDADDICIPERFETQLAFLDETGADVVGGYIAEFEDDPGDPHAVREVPVEHESITAMAKFRCPMNQTTVSARRESIVDAGNYRPVDRMEDYEIWARMIQSGYEFRNQAKVLVKVRGGTNMYTRRGGLEYAREEIRLQKDFYDIGFVSAPRAFSNAMIRTVPRLLPNRIRGQLYQRFLRA
ncbi:glycosyltransferase [Haloterrigena sp. H1]|uniref:glycosyltransferase n=1 Tax=Haloterrigena sp. H1 TaxID=2552943 RepID=UPI0014862203|nr:glycosyltransferase [Haloterrigena sp. H1]